MTLYTSKVIAQWLCLTERRVRQLRDEGVIVEARPGLYELQPTVARYIKYLGGAGKESLNTERMKLTAEKRKAAEMDNDLRRGDLHSTQDIEKGIQTMCLPPVWMCRMTALRLRSWVGALARKAGESDTKRFTAIC